MFTKSDLKNGDVCVTASGRVFMAMPEFDRFECKDLTLYFNAYTDDLKCKIDMDSNINKVYSPTSVRQISFNPEKYERGILVFDRSAEEKKTEEEKTVREVKRAAKVGEWVRDNRTKEICKAIALDYTGDRWTYVRSKIHRSNGAFADRPIEPPYSFIHNDNYVVLENYNPHPYDDCKPNTNKPTPEPAKVEKTFKVVFVTQGEKDYLFEVPADLDLKKGDKVLCKTMRGLQEGVCRMNSTEISEGALLALTKMCGAYLPLKKIVDKVVELYPNPNLDMAKVKYIQSEGVLYKIEKIKE